MIVVGGGMAGVAAAVAAARNGAAVALLEKECSLGGLATLGNVVIYLPLCDGMGHQVVKGLSEELLKLSVRDRYDKIPSCWTPGGDIQERIHSRYRVQFNPASFMLALEELLLEEGVAVHYDTRFCDVKKKGAQIAAVVVENKDGRSALLAKTVVDATGDADVCARAGEKTVSLATNTPTAWFFYSDGEDVKLSTVHVPFDGHGQSVSTGESGYAGDRACDVTQHVIDSRKLIRKELALRAVSSGSVHPLVLPTIPTFRMTRRLKSSIELDEADERKCFPDSIGMTGDWRKPGPVYYLPFRALIGVKTANLIAAGRCISAGTAWDITRAIPACAVTGEAAGTAAALASHMKSPRFSGIDIHALQAQLRKQKVLLKKQIPLYSATHEKPEESP